MTPLAKALAETAVSNPKWWRSSGNEKLLAPFPQCGTPDGMTQCMAILQAEGRRKLRPAAYAAWRQDP